MNRAHFCKFLNFPVQGRHYLEFKKKKAEPKVSNAYKQNTS